MISSGREGGEERAGPADATLVWFAFGRVMGAGFGCRAGPIGPPVQQGEAQKRSGECSDSFLLLAAGSWRAPARPRLQPLRYTGNRGRQAPRDLLGRRKGFFSPILQCAGRYIYARGHEDATDPTVVKPNPNQ